MAIVAVGDTWAIKVGCQGLAQAGINTVHQYCITVAGGSVTDAELATYYRTAYNTAWCAVMTNSASFYGIKVQRVNPLPSPVPIVSTVGSQAGTAGTNPLPQQVSGIITLYTALGGRAGRGRLYIPFPDQADNDPTAIAPTAGYITRLIAVTTAVVSIDNVVGAFGSCQMETVIWHRSTRTVTSLTVGTARGKWAGQHKRGAYGKTNSAPPF